MIYKGLSLFGKTKYVFQVNINVSFLNYELPFYQELVFNYMRFIRQLTLFPE